MKFLVVCTEQVSTEFTVEVPTRGTLDTWLEKEGPDMVSMFTGRQAVGERDYEVFELTAKRGEKIDVLVDETLTVSMKADDPNVVFRNCDILPREGDEGFHLKSPLVIDGYAIVPKDMVVTFEELLKGVT